MTQERVKRNLPSLILVLITVLLVASGLWLMLSNGGAQEFVKTWSQDAIGSNRYSWLDRSWAALTFEAEATPKQLAKLRPLYQDAWGARAAALKRAQAQSEQKVLPKLRPRAAGEVIPKVEIDDVKPAEFRIKGEWKKGELKWNKAAGPMSLGEVLEEMRKDIQAELREVLSDEQLRAHGLYVRDGPGNVSLKAEG